jgi:hypothetical protein
MGQEFEDEFTSAADKAQQWWFAHRGQVAADAQNAYQRGRQIYADAIRTGQNVVARTPQEVRNLGAAANAFVRSSGNAVSLDYADNADAATAALFGGGGTGDFGDRYQTELAAQHTADRQNAQDHPWATGAGNLFGTVGGIFALDTPAVAGAAARLLPGGAKAFQAGQAAKRIGFVPEGWGTMAAVGGGTVGGLTQLGNDAEKGKLSSPGDLAGAVEGGALGGLGAIHGGPVFGAALGGGATAALQGDDLDDISQDAMVSAYGGRVLGTLGEFGANALPRALKGSLGESLSFAKSWARGEPIPFEPGDSVAVTQNLPATGQAGGQQKVRVGGDRYTRADWLTDWGRALEAKFGNSASLTPNQKLAIPQLGALYLPDHFLPRDIGELSAGWFGPTVDQSSPDDGASP